MLFTNVTAVEFLSLVQLRKMTIPCVYFFLCLICSLRLSASIFGIFPFSGIHLDALLSQCLFYGLFDMFLMLCARRSAWGFDISW